jgi:hypothetical protein
MTPAHGCPWCRCALVDEWNPGTFNRDAPFARLVLEIDELFGTFQATGAGRGVRYRVAS